MSASALGTFFGSFLGYNYLAAFITIICGDSVAPPKLSGNTPVFDVVSPVKICLFHTFGNKLDLTGLYSLDCWLDKLIHLNEPLLFNKRFYRCMTSVVCTYVM